MKKNLIKGLLLIVLSLVLVGTNSVFAADTSGIDELLDVTDIPTTTSTDTPSTPTTTSTDTPSTTTSTPSTSTEKKEEVTTGNSSVYNNTTTPTQTTTTEKKDDKSLSKAGLEDSLPMVALIAVFGISAIVAFKKIKEYKNV